MNRYVFIIFGRKNITILRFLVVRSFVIRVLSPSRSKIKPDEDRGQEEMWTERTNEYSIYTNESVSHVFIAHLTLCYTNLQKQQQPNELREWLVDWKKCEKQTKFIDSVRQIYFLQLFYKSRKRMKRFFLRLIDLFLKAHSCLLL